MILRNHSYNLQRKLPLVTDSRCFTAAVLSFPCFARKIFLFFEFYGFLQRKAGLSYLMPECTLPIVIYNGIFFIAS